MGISFNIDEVFEIAEQIERNGSTFYKQAAKLCTSPQASRIFNDLSHMEANHEQVFHALREQFSTHPATDDYYDPFEESILYLKAFADGKVFPLEIMFNNEIQEKESLQAIIKYAIEREKDSIVFYLGMKELVPDHLGKGKVDEIIKEEMKHIRMLTEGVIK